MITVQLVGGPLDGERHDLDVDNAPPNWSFPLEDEATPATYARVDDDPDGEVYTFEYVENPEA